MIYISSKHLTWAAGSDVARKQRRRRVQWPFPHPLLNMPITLIEMQII